MNRRSLLLLLALSGCAARARNAPASQSDLAAPRAGTALHSVTLPGREVPVPKDRIHSIKPRLNGKASKLQFLHESGGASVASTSPVVVALSASFGMHIPAIIGEGHGPYARIYDETKDVRVEAQRLGLEGSDGRLVVTCNEVGVFPVTATALNVDGEPITDSYDVECVAPTRIRAEIEPDLTYLANSSTVMATVSWFGKQQNGHEAELLGTLPITLAPGESAAKLSTAGSGRVALEPTTAMSGTVGIASAGLTASVPIHAIDRDWKLKVTFAGTAPRLTVIASAEDGKGVRVAISDCSLNGSQAIISGRGTSATAHPMTSFSGTCIAPRLVPPTKLEAVGGALRPGDWTADSVCVRVLDQQTCADVPR